LLLLSPGHLDTLLSDQVHQQLGDWTDKYGPIFRLQVANKFAVVVTEPAAAVQLLRKGSPNYLQKSPDMYAALELGSTPHVHNILSSLDTPYWKAVRSGLAPCFSLSNLKKVRRAYGGSRGSGRWQLLAVGGYRRGRDG
jgi:cytochrome P450